MTLEELIVALLGSFSLMTLVQISPLKINPWSWIRRSFQWLWHRFCRSFNSVVLDELHTMQKDLRDTKLQLENHIKLDDEREADKVRASILRFNNELLRDILHTKEEFVEILAKIDWYRNFCKTHESYQNSRAVHAIANIERTYADRLRFHDFL